MVPDSVIGFAVALGIGLLVGLERERRKGRGPSRGAAGVRTFAMTSLAGALALQVGGEIVLATAALFTAALTALAYRRSAATDPGLTTEMALLVTLLLGALATRAPGLAAGGAVVVAIVLASRDRLHHFVRGALSEQELHDALLFAAAALIVLPLTPDRPVGPYAVLNPRTLWRLVVLLLGIQGAGHVAVRALGEGRGLPLAGFVGGFVSSTATIAAMGARARKSRDSIGAATAAAVLSTVATIAQMAVVLWATAPPVLLAMVAPLAAAGVVAIAYGLAFAARGSRGSRGARDGTGESGRAFRLGPALILVATIAVVLLIGAALDDAFGHTGLLVASALAGLSDAHAAAISVASLANVGRLDPHAAVVPILAGLSTNTLSKIIAATSAGGPRFAWQVSPGLLAVMAAAWTGYVLTSVTH